MLLADTAYNNEIRLNETVNTIMGRGQQRFGDHFGPLEYIALAVLL